MGTLKIKRVYEPAEESDGFRLLVDRIWPRGVTKEAAQVDVWLKEIAPSAGLRKWFQHDVKKWASFAEKYKAELKESPAMNELKTYLQEHKTTTLLYGAKDEQHNQAVVLQAYLENHDV